MASRVLLAALGFAQLTPVAPPLRALHDWIDTWAGVRWIATEMRRGDHGLALTRGPAGWTATFTFVGKSNLPPAAPSGLATLATPWSAVQCAAWMVVRRSW